MSAVDPDEAGTAWWECDRCHWTEEVDPAEVEHLEFGAEKEMWCHGECMDDERLFFLIKDGC